MTEMQLPYVVRKEFRFLGRSYAVGDRFLPGRLLMSPRDLRDLLAKGYIERQDDASED